MLKCMELYKKPPVSERKPNLYYYDLRSGDGDGFDIERSVFVNHEGSLVTNVDILAGLEYLNDEDFCKLNPHFVMTMEELES